MKWIGDRLPEKEGRYLVYAESEDPDKPFIYVVFFNAEIPTWEGIPQVWAEAVTHWMYLPNAPKDDNEQT